MSNIIQLLPDSVANQIAAGEVIQRPASVVKELMENAIDAESSIIKVIVKEAGRSLIQIIDNGRGMTDVDARMAFERHATSKIKEANDLFAIHTMGFRGEALASIAAVAQVELKTRTSDDELGTYIRIAASRVESQESVQCPVGTQFIIKNLFYNIPARRRFLKQNSTELRHIINEFQRVALANPEVAVSLYHNDVPIFDLPGGNYRQRIIHLMGKQMNQHLIPVETSTSIINIHGFIGKPESARKKMGDQFFFVNHRYMRHPYLHKAIMTAYENILPTDTIPAYFLYFEVDPAIIDINIHPTKTEIKFEDEKAIWQILSAAIRECLGKFNLVPSIDFDTADSIEIPVASRSEEVIEPTIDVNPHFNPFEEYSRPRGGGSSSFQTSRSQPIDSWEQLYSGFEKEAHSSESITPELSFETLPQTPSEPVQQTLITSEENNQPTSTQRFFQLKNKYILTAIKSGLMIIDQRRAHERILFEQFMNTIQSGKSLSQQSLFPEELSFDAADAELIRDLLEDINLFGLQLEEKSPGTFLVSGLPGHLENAAARTLIDGILSDCKTGEIDLKQEVNRQIAASMAKKAAMPSGKYLSPVEMGELFDQLFACREPGYTPNGKTILSIINNEELDKRFT
jgi:DNA mismatch repair protein MutL